MADIKQTIEYLSGNLLISSIFAIMTVISMVFIMTVGYTMNNSMMMLAPLLGFPVLLLKITGKM